LEYGLSKGLSQCKLGSVARSEIEIRFSDVVAEQREKSIGHGVQIIVNDKYQ
jgi:hypothetical protein